jgi:hypothetical protein
MKQLPNIDGVLIQWGDRLFYPGNRIVRPTPQPRLKDWSAARRANEIRTRIEATAVRRAPQVMVKVTGGGRGMKAIAAHLRYISKNGRLDIEDEEGNKSRGREALREIADEWRLGGTLIEDVSDRREAYNIMLSMPRGRADPLIVERAAREFAQAELADHKYVMVLHDHQTNPHVHISVRAESMHGKRLNPRKTDLHRWRETFAEKLRGWGIDAEASRQATRGRDRNYDELWQVKAREAARLLNPGSPMKAGPRAAASRASALEAWQHIRHALLASPNTDDQRLAAGIARFVRDFEAGRVDREAVRSAQLAPLQIKGTAGEQERSR